jgi:hypothetical protein
MADPRNTVSFTDIDYDAVTFISDGSTIVYDSTKAGGSASVGLAVTLSGNGTVALAADGDKIIGKLISVESDDRAAVQTDGFVTLPAGSGATVTRGTSIVGALGASSAKGYIRTTASATAAELVKQTGTIIDVADTAAVVVYLC